MKAVDTSVVIAAFASWQDLHQQARAVVAAHQCTPRAECIGGVRRSDTLAVPHRASPAVTRPADDRPLTSSSDPLSIAAMLSVKVSTKHQIVVPSQARKSLGIEAGDRLEVEITPDAIILRPRGQSAGSRLRGLGREAWVDIDPVEYVRQLRNQWDERIPR